MRIVFSTDWYSEGMGYSENILPIVLARMGHEVFVVSSTMQVYGDHAFYRDVYERFLGPAILEPGTKVIDGVTLIRLPIQLWWKRLKIARGRVQAVVDLRPDIVFSYDPRSMQTAMLSAAAWFSDFKLFSSVHTVASVYPAFYHYAEMPILRRAWLRLTDTWIGWFASRRIEVSYANTPDAVEIALRFLGARSGRVKLIPSGLDVAHLRPARDAQDARERTAIRASLGVTDDEILCIYTGRLTAAKNPKVLAEAVRILRENRKPYRAIFFGEGEQAAEIASVDGCAVMPFVKYQALPAYYRAVDVGVWPRQESVSMTDAAACGTPIIASDRMLARERIDGNGLSYVENDPADLARVLTELADPALRARLGARGAEKMVAQFNIEKTAAEVLADFRLAIGGAAVAREAGADA